MDHTRIILRVIDLAGRQLQRSPYGEVMRYCSQELLEFVVRLLEMMIQHGLPYYEAANKVMEDYGELCTAIGRPGDEQLPEGYKELLVDLATFILEVTPDISVKTLATLKKELEACV